MVSLVSNLHDKGYGIYLRSNAASRFHTYKENYEVFKYFNHFTIFADLKVSKRNPTFYQNVLGNHELNPASCFFIDDLEVNIKGAKILGIAGYHYNDNILVFRKHLKNINVL